MKLEFMQNREILLWAIGLATPFFLFFGWLSDKVGRKWIMLTGMMLGVLFYRPIFGELLRSANVKEWIKDKKNLKELDSKAIITKDTLSDTNHSTIVNSTFTWGYKEFKFTERRSDTFVEKDFNGLGWHTSIYPPNSALKDIDTTLMINTKFIPSYKDDAEILLLKKRSSYSDIVLSTPLKWKFIFLVWIMIIFVTMAYGPIAAFLVELFPTKIRYTSMSLPYHIGNGVFGGLVPFIATLLSTTFIKDPLVGLWYPIGVASLCFIIGALYLSNKIDKDVTD